jgi:HSP20 family molecular chaperone IbpA
MPDGKRPSTDPFDLDQAFEGVFKGIGGIFEALASAIEGVGTATGSAASAPRAQPRPTAKQPAPARQAPATQRAPLLDVFDEGRVVLVVAALPGAQPADVEVEAQDDIVALRVSGARPWVHELLLPALVDPATLHWALRNGILEISVAKLTDKG